MPKFLIVVAGPTAVGKTALSITLAKHFHTEILSADSRQFFKELNIGVAKPSAGQLQAVKHHFINTLSIKEDYNAGKYEQDALRILEGIFRQKDHALITGGSGLYIKAVCEGFDELPKSNASIRNALVKTLEEKGIAHLQDKLKLVDPDYHKKVDLNNPQRLIRALEVNELTGKPFSGFQKKTKKPRPFHVIKIGINMDRQQLYERINQRVDQMMEAGLLEEVKQLKPFQSCNALQTVGYQELFEYLDKKITLAKAVSLIKQNTRKYAKRQLTWFKKDAAIHWFEPGDTVDIQDYIYSAEIG